MLGFSEWWEIPGAILEITCILLLSIFLQCVEEDGAGY